MMGKVEVLATEDTCTTRELAKHWDVPLPTVRKAAHNGKIPGSAFVLGRYLFNKEVAIAGWEPPEVKRRKDEAANSHEVGAGSPPPVKRKAKYLKLLSQVVDEQVWKDIILKAVAQAKEGDRYARKWLSDYLIGTPVQRVLVDAAITTHRDFDVGQRAAAAEALLQSVTDGRVVDGVATPLD